LIKQELYDGVRDGQFGLEEGMGFLFAIELCFVILGGSFESRGGGNQMRGGEALLEECLPARLVSSGARWVIKE
jgi:hypothetical protein